MGIFLFAEHSSPVWKLGREVQDDPSTVLGYKLEAHRESTEVTKAM